MNQKKDYKKAFEQLYYAEVEERKKIVALSRLDKKMNNPEWERFYWEMENPKNYK